MKLVIAAVGRLKSGPERDLCERYGERLRASARSIGVSEVRLVEIGESGQRRPEDRKRDEAAELSAALPANATLILFDERGKTLSSEEFAALIRAYRAANTDALCFAIGGPDGIDESLRKSAATIISFGRMTMPHQIVRALLLEQLYRAVTILTGHPYHRA